MRRGFFGAGEKRQEIRAIERRKLGVALGARNRQCRRENIGRAHGPRGGTAGGHAAGPRHDEWNAEAAFEDVALLAPALACQLNGAESRSARI